MRRKNDVKYKKIDFQMLVRLLDHVTDEKVFGYETGDLFGPCFGRVLTQNRILEILLRLIEPNMNGSTENEMMAERCHVDDERQPEPDHMSDAPRKVNHRVRTRPFLGENLVGKESINVQKCRDQCCHRAGHIHEICHETTGTTHRRQRFHFQARIQMVQFLHPTVLKVCQPFTMVTIVSGYPSIDDERMNATGESE